MQGTVTTSPEAGKAATRADASWLRVANPADCAAILEAPLNVLVWSRTMTPDCRAALLSLADGTEQLERWEFAAGNDPFHRASGRLPSWLMPVREFLGSQLGLLGEVLADLTGSERIGLRLAATRRQTCPRFHVDRTTLRVVCTWLGPGTEWLDNAAVDRNRLGVPPAGVSPTAWDPLLQGGLVHQSAPGEVVFLKGESWPGCTGTGAVHRSPPVPPGRARIMATLDAL